MQKFVPNLGVGRRNQMFPSLVFTHMVSVTAMISTGTLSTASPIFQVAVTKLALAQNGTSSISVTQVSTHANWNHDSD